jgi:hypothetical protein
MQLPSLISLEETDVVDTGAQRAPAPLQLSRFHYFIEEFLYIKLTSKG